jgi:photosystem II stability/assembly factor-like uncharacterized protein
MKSGIKIVVLISIVLASCSEKPFTQYGPDFPFNKIYETTIDMGTWEISKVSYEFKLQVRDVFFLNTDTGFLVGNEGRIFRTTDSGETWRKIDSGTRLNIVSVYFIDDRVGYASSEGLNCPWSDCSQGSFMLKTTDCGETWTKLPFPEYYRILSLKFSDESHGVAIIYTEGQKDSLIANVATSSDGGSSWEMADLTLKHGVEKLFFVEDLIFAQGVHQQLYKSLDLGVTWDTINVPVDQNNSFRYFYFINGNTGFVDATTSVYKTTDGGNNWAEVHFPFPYSDPLYFYDEDEGFRLRGAHFFINESRDPTSGSIFFITGDGGNTWTQGTLSELVSMYDTHFPYHGYGFGFGNSDFYRFIRKSD